MLSLNHPNIVTLFDLGHADGAFFMATEYVEGETLRARLQREGALSARAAIDLALQIAAALVAAHAAGIIHRDIKPENAMIRRDGYVKVLDFGLAKVNETRADDTDSEESSLTDTGAVMGTARYMSPEQARGLRVNHRSDQFSLAVVLYEMLAARAPFIGETRGDLLVAILTAAPPPLVESAPATPAVVETILRRALEKEVDARYASVAEFAEALKAVAAELAFTSRDSHALPLVSGPVVQPVRVRRIGYKLRLMAAVVVMSLAGAFGWFAYKQTRHRMTADILPQLQFKLIDSWKAEADLATTVFSSSPDGNLLAYAKTDKGQADIYVKQINGGQARNLTNDTWIDYSPLWSPDGQRVAYLSQRASKAEVWLIPFLGGNGQMVKTLDVQPRWLTSWTRNAARIYYEAKGNLFALEVADWTSRQVTNFPTDSKKAEFAVSADEQWLAYQDEVADTEHLFIAPLKGGLPVQLTHEGSLNSSALWLPDNERLIYTSARNGIQQICLAFRDGRQPIQLTSGHESVIPWEVTAAGDKIFYFSQHEESDLYLLNPANGVERRLSTEVLQEVAPVFSPDGKMIAFLQCGNFNNLGLYQSVIYGQTTSGGEVLRLQNNGFDVRWSPVGDKLAFLRLREQGGFDAQLWVMRQDGANAQPVVKGQISFLGYFPSPFSWTFPPNFSWSPDGQRLAYGLQKDGVINLHTIASDGSDETRLTDNADTSFKMYSPLWSPDGQRIAYLGRMTGASNPRSLWMVANAQPQMVWQIVDEMRLLGWSPAGDQVFVSVVRPPRRNIPVEVKVFRVWPERNSAQEVARFADTYLVNLVLMPTAQQVAYVARQDDADNIWIASLVTGQRRRLTANTDPNLNYGSLTWSPQSNLLGYTKQSNATSIRVIENFK